MSNLSILSIPSPISTSKRRWMLLAVLLVISALLVTGVLAQEAVEDPAITTAKQATVFLMQTYDVAGSQALSCVGSGTLINADGLILTNAHLALAEGPCRGERIVVALATRLDEPPVPTYVAQIVQIDVHLDLAILQITGGLDGSVISPTDLSLPYVQTGNPLGMSFGTTATFVGYPDTGASSVAQTEGQIIGTTAETSGGRLAWLRTDAQLSGVMSGGGAYDSAGMLVGVLTSASSTDGNSPGPTCLNIQDNTRDGLITEQDACTPIGEIITQIRTIDFAMPLIESARNRFVLSHRPGFPPNPPVDPPVINRLFFSTVVNEFGEPTRIVTTAPSGTTSLFLYFDYHNMRPSTPYQIRVTHDGIEQPALGLGPLAWGGGTNGKWYVGTENVTWPDGNYEFTILINGQPVASKSITIGSGQTEPLFTNIRFGILSPAGGFTRESTLISMQGTTEVFAVFDGENVPTQQFWTEVWYFDGTEVSRITRTWDVEPNGQFRVSALNYEGLRMGTYRLELYIDERLAATGDVTLAGNQGPNNAPAIFSEPSFADSITRDGLPTGKTGQVLPLGTTSVYAFVDWNFMPNNVWWTYRWYLDGRRIASSTQRWDAGGVGERFWISIDNAEALPEGTYAVEIFVEDQPILSKDFSIGSGTQPLTGAQGESEDLFVSGTVIDAVTGNGISGALIFVLDVAFESPQFLWEESQIHTQAITDENGRFSLQRGLPKGNYYTVFIMADGYISIVEDNFWVFNSQESPVDIVIEMSKP